MACVVWGFGLVIGIVASEIQLELQHLAPEQTLLVGISGGRDSMCLLDLLQNLGFSKLVVVHVNHGLRAESADADEALVRNRCAELGLECHVEQADVAALMERERWGLEKAARVARHEAFARAAELYQTSSVLLAHHADDQAETVLFNLMRGSYGLKAMQWRSEMLALGKTLVIYRPLLAVRRCDITEYMEHRGLEFREDETNAEAITARNRIRNEALPLLADIMQRDVVAALNVAAEMSAELQDFSETQGASLASVLDPQGRIHLPSFRQLHRVEQSRLMHQFLQQSGVPDLRRSTVLECLQLCYSEAVAKCNLPGAAWLRRREQRIFVERG